MNLSEKIRNRREQLDLTQQQIGEYIGVSKATIQRYESGEIQNLKQGHIEKIAEILKVSPGFLMGWEDDKGNPTKEYIKEYVEKESFVDSLISLLVKQGKVEKYSDLTESQRKMIELAITQQIEEKNKGSI